MTAQKADKLIVDTSVVKFPKLGLYGVLTGDIEVPASLKPYEFSAQGQPGKMETSSALWRGYLSTYRITADGRLRLEGIEYPYTPDLAPEAVGEFAEGDFWLDLRDRFFGLALYVPFRDGKLVTDRKQWKERNLAARSCRG